MDRKRYLVTYDVADDRRRTKLFQRLLAEGDHVQYSVFLCELSRRELAQLRADATAVIDHAADQVLLLDLGKATRAMDVRIEVLGRPFERPDRIIVV